MKRRRVLSVIMMMVAVLIMSLNAQAAVKISKKSATLIKGQSLTLKITGTKEKVKWSTNKKKVATVTQKGVVKAKAKGTAIISAKVGKKTYKCKVKVETPKISKTKATLNVGQKLTLKIAGNTQKVKWSSSKKTVATVNQKGVVTAKKAGLVYITATIAKKKYNCKVAVKTQNDQKQIVPSSEPVDSKSDEREEEDGVTDPEKSEPIIVDYVQKVKDGIKARTAINSAGNKCIVRENIVSFTSSAGTQYTTKYVYELSYIVNKDTFCINMKQYMNGSSICVTDISIEFDGSETSKASVSYESTDSNATTSFLPSTYTSSNALIFDVVFKDPKPWDDSSMEENMANSAIKATMDGLRVILLENFEIDLDKMGFASY